MVPTSHAAIMARTFEIPAVMGVGDIESFVDGEKAVVLGTDGIVKQIHLMRIGLNIQIKR